MNFLAAFHLKCPYFADTLLDIYFLSFSRSSLFSAYCIMNDVYT